MKKILLTAGLLATVLTSAWSQKEQKAQIRLKDGTRIQGTFVEEKDNGNIILEQRDGVEYEYASDEIAGFKFIKDSKRGHRTRGYAAITIGGNIPLGDFGRVRGGNADPGANFNADFGLLFNKYVGITGRIYGASNAFNDTYYYYYDDSDYWNYGGMAVGPLFSLPAARWLDIDLKPMIAYTITSFPGTGWDDLKVSPAFIGSAMARFHVGRRISLVFETNYFYTSSRWDSRYHQRISTLSFNGGVAFRFK